VCVPCSMVPRGAPISLSVLKEESPATPEPQENPSLKLVDAQSAARRASRFGLTWPPANSARHDSDPVADAAGGAEDQWIIEPGAAADRPATATMSSSQTYIGHPRGVGNVDRDQVVDVRIRVRFIMPGIIAEADFRSWNAHR
jgi:hypothetical protein